MHHLWLQYKINKSLHAKKKSASQSEEQENQVPKQWCIFSRIFQSKDVILEDEAHFTTHKCIRKYSTTVSHVFCIPLNNQSKI